MGLQEMEYLQQRAGNFYYFRRVPAAVRQYDPRTFIRKSLKTDSRKTAMRLAVHESEKLESYWTALVQTGQKHTDQQYRAVTERTRLLGFPYHQNSSLALQPLHLIVERLQHVEKHDYNEKHVEAVMGGKAPPPFLLDNVLPRYWEIAKDKIIHKSPDHVRKWRNPRIKAFRNLIRCIGNKPVNELVRSDLLKFRDWWIERINLGKAVCATANKDLMHVKTIICVVAENEGIALDDKIFRKLQLSEDDSVQRLPFTPDQLTALLNPENLAGLNFQARNALLAFSETGAGPAELSGLLPEDIKMNDPIPHIHIVPRHKKLLKTKFRERTIPLVGYALDAFKACPDGFTEYVGRPDSLSATINKYLKENNLLPSDQHSLYSLRHNFQDRLLEVSTPDRIQTSLMGHKFQREAYGIGATLPQKQEFMHKIQLKKHKPSVSNSIGMTFSE